MYHTRELIIHLEPTPTQIICRNHQTYANTLINIYISNFLKHVSVGGGSKCIIYIVNTCPRDGTPTIRCYLIASAVSAMASFGPSPCDSHSMVWAVVRAAVLIVFRGRQTVEGLTIAS